MAKLSSTGITITAVKTILGESSTVLSTLCKSGKINKWSFWKPTLSSATTLTEEAIAQAWCSLSPTYVDVTGVKIYGKTSTGSSQPSLGGQWAYSKPTIYRLGDFRNYNHDAVPCDGNYNSGVTIPVKDLATNVGASSNWTGSGYDWYPASSFSGWSGGTFQYLSFRWSDNSADVVGSIGECIPLSKLVDINSNLRLGLLILYSGTYYMIVGTHCIGRGTNATQLLPSLSTNTVLVSALKNNKDGVYTAYPCLVQNAVRSTLAVSASEQQTYISSWSNLYTMPSGQGSITLKNNVTSTPATDDFGYYAYITTVSGFYLCYRSIQTNPDGSAVLQYVVFPTGTAMTAKTFQRIIYKKDGTRTTTSYNVAAGSQIQYKTNGSKRSGAILFTENSTTLTGSNVSYWTLDGVRIN